MLEITRSRIEKKGLSSRVTLKCADAAKLPFEAEFFDTVFMSFTLELFDTPEIPKVLHECKRVLPNGGRICVVSLSKEGELSWMRELYEWGHKRFPRLLDCRPIFVRRALEDSGFRISDAALMSLLRLPVEVVIGCK
jgi:ubiquinone/menaquinone biosynthesis C-methylase UbiE